MSGCGLPAPACDAADGARWAAARFAEAVSSLASSAPTPALLLWVVGAGALLASFTGVYVERAPDGGSARSISAPSLCDGCKRRLSFLDLVPVIGWLAARGRCGSCDARVSPVYPIVEAAAALAAGAMVLTLPPVQALAGSLLAWGLLAAAWYDLAHHEIPDAVTAPIAVLGLLMAMAGGDVGDAVAGGLLCAVVMAVAFKAFGDSEFGVSYGDVTLAGSLGIWVGLAGVLPFLFLSSVVFVIHALVLGEERRVDGVPMGPSLCAAGLAIWWVVRV